jgi:hypothetical protein
LEADVSKPCLPLFHTLTSSPQPTLRGYRLRLERKEYTMRRNMRMGRVPLVPRRQQDPVLVHLYNQGLEMGLPRDQAARILTLAYRPRNSSAYGNPASGSPAASGAAYDSSAPSHGPLPYRPRPSNVDYQQIVAPSYGSSPYRSQTSNVDYQQLAAPQMSEQYGPYPRNEIAPSSAPQSLLQAGDVDYQQLPAPQMHQPYGQYATTELAQSSIPYYMNDGTTYYTDPNATNQIAVQHGPGVPMEPIYGTGYSYNYEYETYAPLNPPAETTDTEHRYSHESYGPATYAAEPHMPPPYPRQSNHGHGQGNN